MAVQNKQTAKHRQAMIVVLFACNLLASLMQSLMNVALDYVSAEYHVSLSEANLLVLGYSIVAGIVIVLAALSLHRFGLRKVMLFGLIVSFVGSMLGVVAWNFPSLVAARLIQAVATGLYFPVVNEALLNLSPKNGAGRLLAINSGIIGIGLAVAPIVAGLVITYWGLRVLFAIPAVTAFVLFFIARRTIVDIMPRQKLPVDGLSVVLIAVGLSAFMIGLNEVTRNPLPMAALMIAGIAVCAWFIHRQGRLAHPLLDMRPLRNKTYALGETLIVLSYMSSIYLSLLIPLYLEGVAGFTPFIAGCLLRRRCAMRVCALSAAGRSGRRECGRLCPSDSACALSDSWRLRCSRGSILHWPSWAAWRLRARESAPSILRLRASIWRCSRPSCPQVDRRSIPRWCRSQDLFRRRSSSVSCRGRFTA